MVAEGLEQGVGDCIAHSRPGFSIQHKSLKHSEDLFLRAESGVTYPCAQPGVASKHKQNKTDMAALQMCLKPTRKNSVLRVPGF